MTLRLGVDAMNLLDDRRGMGRFARQMLQAAYDAPGVCITLIAKRPYPAAAYSALLERDVQAVLSPPAARRRTLDVVWYPWNGLRFVHPAPAVVTIHDVFAFTQPHRNVVSRWREQHPVRQAALKATRVVTVSRWSAAEIMRILGIKRDVIRIIPHAPRAFWAPAPSPANAVQYFVFVAGPEQRKNAPFLFAAFQQAFPRGEAQLVVVGALSPRDRRLLAELSINVRHVQPDDEQLRTLYTGALAVAVPSLAEGFGLVSVEAIACGAAVLASNTSALPETCGEGAELLDPYDLRLWSTTLRKVFEDTGFRQELRARAARRRAQFDSDAPARGMLTVLREVGSV